MLTWTGRVCGACEVMLGCGVIGRWGKMGDAFPNVDLGSRVLSSAEYGGMEHVDV